MDVQLTQRCEDLRAEAVMPGSMSALCIRSELQGTDPQSISYIALSVSIELLCAAADADFHYAVIHTSFEGKAAQVTHKSACRQRRYAIKLKPP